MYKMIRLDATISEFRDIPLTMKLLMISSEPSFDLQIKYFLWVVKGPASKGLS